MPKKITIALAGNPNSGKTTIFNNLTGSRQHVGNYPGVTVEKKEGTLLYKGYTIHVVDLPGTYGLTAYSKDELIARNFIIDENPDVVIDIIDSSNLERNLYLTTQFIDLEAPLVLAFNMHDTAEKEGLSIDKEKLSELLGSPIVFTVGNKKLGMSELLDEAINVAERKTPLEGTIVRYGREIREEIVHLESVIAEEESLIGKYSSRWLAIKLLDGDRDVRKKIEKSTQGREILEKAGKSASHIKSIFGDPSEAVMAERRYGFISGAVSEAARRTIETRHSVSDAIDKVLLNKVLGLPIFFVVVWAMFKVTFSLSAPMMRLIERAQAFLGGLVSVVLPGEGTLESLIVDGVIAGVGSVLVFAPVIFLLFLVMALLEDSGYMARAAFLMDGFMHKIGLHGRSFIPMLLGFGCNVPAIMATRTIEDRQDRFVTILINPFMSCGARLPIYALFIGAFFQEKIAGNVLFGIYFIGIVIAIITAKLFRRYIFKGETASFVMELPPYRMPTAKGIFTHMWERGYLYLKKAGTIIFVGSIVLWLLSHFPSGTMETSYAGAMGKKITPIFKPLGFDSWKVTTGLMAGFIGKENMVATLGILYSDKNVPGEGDSLRDSIQSARKPDGDKLFTPLSAFALMVFVLLYAPCIAVFAAIRVETNSLLWPVFMLFYTTAVAWIASFIVYQVGRSLGF